MSDEQKKTAENGVGLRGNVKSNTEEKSQTAVLNRLNKNFRSLSIGKDKLCKLFKTLEERTESAKQIELTNCESIIQDEKVCKENKKIIEESFQLTVTVTGMDGKELTGQVDDIFNSVNFPEEIYSIYIANDSTLRSRYNYTPLNYIQIFFNFSKPGIFDLSHLVSQATPDPITITVIGYDATWVHGVFSEINQFLSQYPSQLKWIHKNGIYDIFLVLLSIPIGFWVSSKLSGFLEKLFDFSGFAKNMSYVYVFVVVIYGFFLLFRYARWIFPLIEYRTSTNKAGKHRVIIIAIILAIMGSAAWDILKILLGSIER